MNLQIKALCEYLVLVVCKHEDFKLARQSPPEYLPHPRQVSSCLFGWIVHDLTPLVPLEVMEQKHKSAPSPGWICFISRYWNMPR